MEATDEKIIEYSKANIFLLIMVACVFLVLGVWMVQLGDVEIRSMPRYRDPLFVHAIGVLTVAFACFGAIAGVQKLRDRRPALVLNSSGILDKSSGSAVGLIPWSDVVGFGIYKVKSQKMLTVKVINPEKYISTGNFINRALSRINSKMSGSPISISANTLKIDFDELLELCKEYHGKYRVID